MRRRVLTSSLLSPPALSHTGKLGTVLTLRDLRVQWVYRHMNNDNTALDSPHGGKHTMPCECIVTVTASAWGSGKASWKRRPANLPIERRFVEGPKGWNSLTLDLVQALA